MAGFKLFRYSCETIQSILINLMKACTLICARNYKEVTIIYLQETITTFKKIFTLIIEGNGNLQSVKSFLPEKGKSEQAQIFQGKILNDSNNSDLI